jgi:hypothetical protein
MAQVIPFIILAAISFSLIWGLLALICFVYRKIRGGGGSPGRSRRGMAVVLTIALVGWAFIDDQPLPTYMNSVASSAITFGGTLLVEEDCVFLEVDGPEDGVVLLYFPTLTTTGFDAATGTVRLAFGKRVSPGERVELSGAIIDSLPRGWVTRRHDPECSAKANGFGIVEGLASAG